MTNTSQSTEESRRSAEAQKTMRRIGLQLLERSKRDMAESGTYEHGTGKARDLLSLLVRANTSKEIPLAQRLSDEDVLARKLLVEICFDELNEWADQRYRPFWWLGMRRTSSLSDYLNVEN